MYTLTAQRDANQAVPNTALVVAEDAVPYGIGMQQTASPRLVFTRSLAVRCCCC
jgi:hypothetical protein